MPRFEWTCEDDEEAIGLATILRRAGAEVWTRDDPAAPPIVRADASGEAIASRMLAHFVREDARDRQAKLDRCDRRGLLWLAIGLAVLAVAAVLLGP